MKYKIILLLLLITIGFVFLKLTTPKKSPLEAIRCANCNVILIGIDTLRADHLGAYGYTKIQTPNIDSLAKNGVLFKSNYSQSINTTPSFMSIFTSLYPTDHGLLLTSPVGLPTTDPTVEQYKPLRISDQIKTLPQALRENGFITQGFITSPSVAGEFGFNQGFDNFLSGSISTERKNFIDFLKQPKKGKFFAFFHDITPHSPYDSEDKYLTVSNGQLTVQGVKFLGSKDPKNPTDVATLNDLYDKGVKDEDAYIGLVLKTLKEEKLFDKTIIVFMSDHGEEIGDHGIFGHVEFYNEVLHVPLIIYSPTIKSTLVIDQITRSIDVMPTILSLTSTATNIPMRGISLAGIMTNPKKDLSLPVISIMGKNESIIENNFKFIDEKNIQFGIKKPISQELYDLENDPKEQNNLINKNLPIETSLMDFLKSTIDKKGYAKKPTEITNIEWKQSTLDKLRSLGY